MRGRGRVMKMVANISARKKQLHEINLSSQGKGMNKFSFRLGG
jgi:hypothetical protein